MWLLIIVVVVLLLRAMQTSQSAAKISMKCTPASNAPTAGDCFKSGNTPVAGVPEKGYPQPGPAQGIHCFHTLPIEISFPVAPPPLAITRPMPSPARNAPSVRPIVRGPISYTMMSPTCSAAVGRSTVCYVSQNKLTQCNFNSYGGAVGYTCVDTCTYGTVG